ncbi:PsbP-related protein [Chloroflexota bacterium]
MKRYIIPIVIILVLASGWLSGCSATTTYQNDQHDYTIDYPSNWVLEASDSKQVFIHPHETEFLYRNVSIKISDPEPLLSIEEEVMSVINTYSMPDCACTIFQIVSSKALENNWDWLLEYIFIKDDPDAGLNLQGQDYFKKTDDFLYVISLTWELESDSIPTELKTIVDSFQIRGATFSQRPCCLDFFRE